MRIEIASRETIERRAKEPFEAKTALISCTDTELMPVTLEHLPEYALRLQFNDVGIDDFMDFDKSLPSEQEVYRLARYHHMITESQAKELSEFYHSIKDKAELYHLSM